MFTGDHSTSGMHRRENGVGLVIEPVGLIRLRLRLCVDARGKQGNCRQHCTQRTMLGMDGDERLHAITLMVIKNEYRFNMPCLRGDL